MADQELNKLNVKSDSLPDNWLVTLVNPVTGAVAENVTIARFIELFTNKQPLATPNNDGLMTAYDKSRLLSIDKKEELRSGNKAILFARVNRNWNSVLNVNYYFASPGYTGQATSGNLIVGMALTSNKVIYNTSGGSEGINRFNFYSRENDGIIEVCAVSVYNTNESLRITDAGSFGVILKDFGLVDVDLSNEIVINGGWKIVQKY